MKAISLVLFFLASCFAAFGQDVTSSYYVLLRNGNKIESMDIQIRYPLFKAPHVIIDGNQDHDLVTVDYIFYNRGSYVAREIGKSRKTSLLNIEISGPVSIYYTEKVSTTYDPYNRMYGGGYYSGGGFYGNPYRTERRRTDYIEKDKYVVNKLNPRNLTLAVSDYQPALELATKARRAQMIGTLASIAGGFFLVAGLYNSDVNIITGEVTPSRMIYVSIPLFIVPVVTGVIRQRNTYDAVRVYNRHFKEQNQN